MPPRPIDATLHGVTDYTAGTLLLTVFPRLAGIEGTRSARQIRIRTLLRIVEVNPGGCGAIPAGIAVYCTSRRQRLGDWLAGTLVVRKSRLRQFRRP